MISSFHISPPKLSVYFLLTHTRATCPAHPIPLDLITRILFGRENKSRSSALWNFLQSPVAFSLLDPIIFLGTPRLSLFCLKHYSTGLCISAWNISRIHNKYTTQRIMVILTPIERETLQVFLHISQLLNVSTFGNTATVHLVPHACQHTTVDQSHSSGVS